MKYSVQFLPVEGEIGPDDHYTHHIDANIEVERYNASHDYGSKTPSLKNGDTKMELYLVTASLQPGDLVVDIFRPKEYGIVSEANINAIEDSEIDWDCNKERMVKSSRFSKGLALKVLGKVSPAALWVAVNDEIEEIDIAWILEEGSAGVRHINLTDMDEEEIRGSKGMVWAIRCPMCKTFH